MFIPDVFAARRLCFVARRPWMVRPLSAAGWGHLLAALDDVVSGRSERKGPPRFDDPRCQDHLASPEGQVLKIWLALEDQGVTYEAATQLWKDSDETERAWLDSVLFAGRRTAAESLDTESDISETWCGKGLAYLAQQIGLEAIGRYSLSQISWLISDGAVDENPAYSPERLKKFSEDTFAKWGDKLKALPPLPMNGTGPGATRNG